MTSSSKPNPPDAVMEIIRDWTGVLAENGADYRQIMFERQAELVVRLLMYPSDGLEPERHALIVAQAKAILR